MRRTRRWLTGIVVAGGMLTGTPSASADDHFIMVREVFAGTAGRPDAEFIELQMYAPNQHLVNGNRVLVYDAAGGLKRVMVFSSNLANGASQSSILIGTVDAARFFGFSPDLFMAPGGMSAAGGRVCYQDTDFTPGVRDCVSWGNFSGAQLPGLGATGTPENSSGGIPNGKSIERDITGGTDPAALDAGDDTNDSDADFDVVFPTPRNNAGQVTDTAGAASVSAGTLSYDAATGVANNATIFSNATNVFVRDNNAPVVTRICVRVLVNQVRCPSATITDAFATVRDLDDIFRATDPTLGITVDGGTGNDRLTTAGGNDILNGGDGNDTLSPGLGSDVLDGGVGADTGTYAPRGAGEPVVVDIDGNADDGNADDEVAGFRDNVLTTVERLIGGNGSDTLTGSGVGNWLTGGPGADFLHGLAGSDKIFASGDGSNDTITCGTGVADHVFADAGDSFPSAGPDTCELVN